MSTPSSRTFLNAAIILGAGLFALGGISSIGPLRDLEQTAVKRVALAVDPAESAFGGEGSQEKPWIRWKSKQVVTPDAPRFLVIDDDPEGYFRTSPPSPVDLAVLFKRLRDLEHVSVASGYVMAWDDPDPLALLGLRKQLDRFDSAVLGLPLARGASAEPVPAPFLRLSIPVKNAEGDVSSLPQVNRVAVSKAELGGESTLAGFTLLENEPDAGDNRRHLLARWQDRIIFALPLASEIASQRIDLKSIRVICGKEIRLGQGGPVIPIDEFGRTAMVPPSSAEDIPATATISEVVPIPPASDPLILRDVREELPQTEKAWSDELPAVVQALRSAPRYERGATLPRPGPLVELALISLLAIFGTWATCLRSLGWRIFVAALVAGFGAELIWLLAERVNTWLPPFAVLGPSVATLLLGLVPGKVPVVVEIPDVPVAEIEPDAVLPILEELPPVIDPPIVDPLPVEAALPPPREEPETKPVQPVVAKKAAKKAGRKSPKKKGR